MNSVYNDEFKGKGLNENKLINKEFTSLKQRAIALWYIFDFKIFR